MATCPVTPPTRRRWQSRYQRLRLRFASIGILSVVSAACTKSLAGLPTLIHTVRVRGAVTRNHFGAGSGVHFVYGRLRGYPKVWR
jgi:hypothetical protein